MKMIELELKAKMSADDLAELINKILTPDQKVGLAKEVAKIASVSGATVAGNGASPPDWEEVVDQLSWASFHMLHIILANGTVENGKHVSVSLNDLKNISIGRDKRFSGLEIRGRNGGINRVCNRMGAPALINTDRTGKIDKVKTLQEVVPAFIAILAEYEDDYQEYLDSKGFTTPPEINLDILSD